MWLAAGVTVSRVCGIMSRLERRQQQDQDARDALEHLSRFCHRISEGLSALTFDERQQLLRLVVEGITVDNGRVRVDTIIPTGDSNLRNRYPELVEGRGASGSTSSPRTGFVTPIVERKYQYPRHSS